MNLKKSSYIQLIKQLKEEILSSRYTAAKLVNKELVTLYFKIGSLLTAKIETEKWGAKVIENISADLQNNLKGLRGFSVSNLKNMKQFYEMYAQFSISQSSTGQLPLAPKNSISQSSTGQFVSIKSRVSKDHGFKNEYDFVNCFFGISFTHHIIILNRTNAINEKLFYIKKAAENQWTASILEYQIESNYFKKQGKSTNNFKKVLPKTLHQKAILAFKDELLLDFINIQDPENPDEREIEEGIIKNLRQFILSLGKEFAYMGNQYRIVHADVEYFIDLLFFHRGLRCLIAIDIKRGKFIPEYAGKMNFYLGVLNKYLKLKDENPSIGIILCKEKTDSTVEFSIADMDKPIGVSKYNLTHDLPKRLKKYLPSADDLINVLNEPQVKYIGTAK
jgi:predicted nuclease of restriction endonuclease-like (RecB) superfamily